MTNTLRADKAILEFVEECFALAKQESPNLRGTLKISYGMRRDETTGQYLLSIEIDEEGTTIDDSQLAQCVTENPFAVEGIVEELGEPGSFGTTASFALPSPPKDNVEWPDDDSSPECEEGTQLQGQRGVAQWCERDGLRQGPSFDWTAGKLDVIRTWYEGEIVTGRIRPSPVRGFSCSALRTPSRRVQGS